MNSEEHRPTPGRHPGSGPTPGPRPTPGPPVPSGPSESDIIAAIDDVVAEVDRINAAISDLASAGEVDLAALTRQADLLEQAHQLLSAALDDVGRENL